MFDNKTIISSRHPILINAGVYAYPVYLLNEGFSNDVPRNVPYRPIILPFSEGMLSLGRDIKRQNTERSNCINLHSTSTALHYIDAIDV